MDPMRAQSRRRGALLEDAILDAVWAELNAHGYAALTMEAVAARARTGKAVLYRRWPNRAALVLAAVRRRVVPFSELVPDTGTLRGDVLALLRAMVERYAEVGPTVVNGLLAEVHDLRLEILDVIPEAMGTVLGRAVDRGEIEGARITPRITRLPMDLVRHDLLVTRTPPSDAALVEIVDDAFLPLLRS
jgi:AcrR family transcriptional regulator